MVEVYKNLYMLDELSKQDIQDLLDLNNITQDEYEEIINSK